MFLKKWASFVLTLTRSSSILVYSVLPPCINQLSFPNVVFIREKNFGAGNRTPAFAAPYKGGPKPDRSWESDILTTVLHRILIINHWYILLYEPSVLRCTDDVRHRTAIYLTHLSLPHAPWTDTYGNSKLQLERLEHRWVLVKMYHGYLSLAAILAGHCVRTADRTAA